MKRNLFLLKSSRNKCIYFFKILFCVLLISLPVSAQQTIAKNYYPNGKLREITHQGFFNGCSVPVGTDSLFTPAGKLMGTRSYTHFLDGEGCHSTITIIETKTYFLNEKLKVVSYQRVPYEGEAWRCGVWKWYNAAGKVLRKKDWGKCIR